MEEDSTYMTNAYNNGLSLAKEFGWTIIHCTDEYNNIKSIEDIHAEIMKEVKNFLNNNN